VIDVVSASAVSPSGHTLVDRAAGTGGQRGGGLASLDKADELVVLMSPWALERPYVWAELGAAWTRRIPILSCSTG
jgi:hypothetical protein